MQIEHNPVRPHANFRLKMKTGILHTRQHKSVEITRGNKVGYIGRGSEAVKSLSDFVNGILINMFTSYRGARQCIKPLLYKVRSFLGKKVNVLVFSRLDALIHLKHILSHKPV